MLAGSHIRPCRTSCSQHVASAVAGAAAVAPPHAALLQPPVGLMLQAGRHANRRQLVLARHTSRCSTVAAATSSSSRSSPHGAAFTSPQLLRCRHGSSTRLCAMKPSNGNRNGKGSSSLPSLLPSLPPPAAAVAAGSSSSTVGAASASPHTMVLPGTPAAAPATTPPAATLEQHQQHQQEQQQQVPPSNLVHQLSSDVQQLLATVRLQQEALTAQQAEIQRLQDTVTQLQQHASDQPQQQQQQQQAQNNAADGVAGDSSGSGPSWGPDDGGGGGGGGAVLRPFDAQKAALLDRRSQGLFDARFHSTSRGAVPPERRLLPERIILVRHAQSEGNVDHGTYTITPDPQVPLTELGWEQARDAGEAIRAHMERLRGGGTDYRLYFYTSPYKRGLQTYEGIRAAFASSQVLGVQEDVQLREQDFGNFQDAEGKQREKAERLRFGRFFYRFPNGESGADVYDRITVFIDHLIRDINAGRFPPGTSLVLVTHGLALRIWLMRWFHWTVDSFMDVYNPPNGVPIILERTPAPTLAGDASWVHTKAMYRLSDHSMRVLRGVTPGMCTTAALPPGSSWAGLGGFLPPQQHQGSGSSGGSSGSNGGSGEGGGQEGSGHESAAEQWAELGGGW